MTELPLGELPSEILLRIFTLLPSKDIVSCIQVNRRFKEIIERSRKFLAKSEIYLCLRVADNGLLICLSDVGIGEFYVEINHGEEEDDNHLQTQFVNFLATYRTTKKTNISTSKNLQSTLFILLKFVINRCAVVMLHVGQVPTIYLNLINKILLEANSRPKLIHMDVNPENQEVAQQTLQLATDGLIMGQFYLSETATTDFLEREFLRKLKRIEFNVFGGYVPFYIGSQIRKYSAKEIAVDKHGYINKEDVVSIIEDWLAGRREITLYQFFLYDQDYEFNFVEGLPFKSIAKFRLNGRRFTRNQDDQHLMFIFKYDRDLASWHGIKLFTRNYPYGPLKRKQASD